MNRMGLFTCRDRRTGSRYDGWLAEMTAGPVAGIFSSPVQS
jgi:hypothetical protein